MLRAGIEFQSQYPTFSIQMKQLLSFDSIET